MRMTKYSVLALSAGLMAIGTPATAQQPAASEEAAEEAVVNAANRVVCRRYPPPTGSRIGPRRVCKTQNEWDRIQDQNDELVDQMTRAPLTSN